MLRKEKPTDRQADHPITLWRVISDYETPYPDGLVLCAGERLSIDESRESEWPGWIWCTAHSGESGWVPEAYLARHGNRGIAVREYDATELSVRTGETVAATIEQAGWRWCTNAQGQSGWVPGEHLHPLGP